MGNYTSRYNCICRKFHFLAEKDGRPKSCSIHSITANKKNNLKKFLCKENKTFSSLEKNSFFLSLVVIYTRVSRVSGQWTAPRDCWKIPYTPAYYGMPYKSPRVIIACRSLAETKNQISPKTSLLSACINMRGSTVLGVYKAIE